MDGSDQRARARRDTDDVSASCLRVRCARHERRDDCTWESKYCYNRRRPSEAEARSPRRCPSPQPVVPVGTCCDGAGCRRGARVFPAGGSPVVPDHGRGGGLVPVLAGLQYPSDYTAGLGLGRAVADRSSPRRRPTAPTPSGPAACHRACKWIGRTQETSRPLAGRPLLLTSAGQFRPAAPPACDTPGGRRLKPRRSRDSPARS